MTVDPISFSAVIFDMDGVLIDSEPLHYEALRSLLAAEGHEWTWEHNERLLGTTAIDSFRIVSELVPLARAPQSYIPEYDRAVLRVLSPELTPAPGVTELIASLTALNVPMAVASSSNRSWIDATLASLGISCAFQAVVSGEDVGSGKPAPDIYLETARKLEVQPRSCVAVEDAPNGIVSAKGAGLSVIAVRTPHTAALSLYGADLVVDSLEQLAVRQSGMAFTLGEAERLPES